jgi:hypothetical protein
MAKKGSFHHFDLPEFATEEGDEVEDEDDVFYEEDMGGGAAAAPSSVQSPPRMNIDFDKIAASVKNINAGRGDSERGTRTRTPTHSGHLVNASDVTIDTLNNLHFRAPPRDGDEKWGAIDVRTRQKIAEGILKALIRVSDRYPIIAKHVESWQHSLSAGEPIEWKRNVAITNGTYGMWAWCDFLSDIGHGNQVESVFHKHGVHTFNQYATETQHQSDVWRITTGQFMEMAA